MRFPNYFTTIFIFFWIQRGDESRSCISHVASNIDLQHEFWETWGLIPSVVSKNKKPRTMSGS